MYVRRKVYSYSEPEEQLYSVTMTEDEYDLFSAVLDEYYDGDYDLYSDDVERRRDIGALVGGGVGLAAAGGVGAAGYYNRDKIAKKITDAAEKRTKGIDKEIKAAQEAAASKKADFTTAKQLKSKYEAEIKALEDLRKSDPAQYGKTFKHDKAIIRKKYQNLAKERLVGDFNVQDFRKLDNKYYLENLDKKTNKLVEDLTKKRAKKGLGEGALETWKGLSRSKKAAVAAGVLGAGALTAGAAGRAIGGATTRRK